MAMSERLRQVVSQAEDLEDDDLVRAFSQLGGVDPGGELATGIPISISLPRIEPYKEQDWKSYRSDCEKSLA